MESFEVPTSDIESRSVEQSRQNIKLIRGVKKLVARLRSMSPEDRTKPETLLGTAPYKKTKQEVLEELRVRHKVVNNPTLSTEDDLVNQVIKNAPRYALEQELKVVRKEITACLKASSADPSNLELAKEAKRLKGKSDLLRRQIGNMKND